MNGYPLTALAHQDLEVRRETAARERLARRLGSRNRARGLPVRFSLGGFEVIVNREARHAVCAL